MEIISIYIKVYKTVCNEYPSMEHTINYLYLLYFNYSKLDDPQENYQNYQK